MKHTLICALALLGFTGMQSCSEKFNVAAPYKDITAAYGLLNMDDSVHYIRIQKAFLDEEKDAVIMATVADSSFHSGITVHIRERNSQGRIISETELPRVDLNTEGYPKEPGSFFNTPSPAYKYARTINPANTYRLVIHNTRTGATDSAETPVISSNRSLELSDFLVYEFRQTGFEIKFTQTRPHDKFTINMRAPAHGSLYEGVIRFHWVDRNILTGETARHSADWTFLTTESNREALTLSIEESRFIPFLEGALRPAPENVERYMDSCDMFVWAATADVQRYREYQRISGGLTGDQIRPVFSNFEGGNTFGLFASRAVQARYGIPIAPPTINMLTENAVLRPMKIRGLWVE